MNGSKSSATVGRACVALAEEIRRVLSANSALFALLWENREREGEGIIRKLHGRRQQDVRYLLATYRSLCERPTSGTRRVT